MGWKEMYWIITKTLGSCRLYYFSLDEGYPTFMCTTRSVNRSAAAARFLLNSIEKWWRESNILTSSAAVYILPNIIYLKTIKYLKIGLRQIYSEKLLNNLFIYSLYVFLKSAHFKRKNTEDKYSKFVRTHAPIDPTVPSTHPVVRTWTLLDWPPFPLLSAYVLYGRSLRSKTIAINQIFK